MRDVLAAKNISLIALNRRSVDAPFARGTASENKADCYDLVNSIRVLVTFDTYLRLLSYYSTP